MIEKDDTNVINSLLHISQNNLPREKIIIEAHKKGTEGMRNSVPDSVTPCPPFSLRDIPGGKPTKRNYTVDTTITQQVALPTDEKPTSSGAAPPKFPLSDLLVKRF